MRFGCGGTRCKFIAPCGLEKSFGGFPSFYSRRWITFRARFLFQGWKTGLGANRGWPPRTLADSCIPWCELSVELWLKIVCTGSRKVSVWFSVGSRSVPVFCLKGGKAGWAGRKPWAATRDTYRQLYPLV